MNVAICLDKVGWKVKPQNESDMIRINNRIAKCRTTIEENEAIELIANQGHSFTPTIFKGQRRKQEDFDELQWFVLDFDSGASYEAIKARCQECGIPILFSYHTFSSTPETPRFRIIFRHAVPVQEMETAKIFLIMLKEIFPEADEHCFEVARMFLGGKGLIEKNMGTAFFAEKLIYAFHYAVQKRDPNNYKRNLRRFSEKHHLELENGILKHIIMTHAQFLNLSELQLSGYTVIIDEDILFTMLRNTKSIPVSEVEKAINAGIIQGKLRTQLESLIQTGKEEYRKIEIENGMENSYIKKETVG